VPGAPLVTLGTTNNRDGFSVLFSETVHMQLAGWSDGLIMVQNEFRLDEIIPYNNFNFKVDIHSTTGEISLQFSVQQSNSTISMYKAACMQAAFYLNNFYWNKTMLNSLLRKTDFLFNFFP